MDKILNLANKMGVVNAARFVRPNALTVLNYHRVDDVTRPGFDTFTPNVTASPDAFEQQMDYIQRHYHVITCENLSHWLRGEQKLPPYSALITFDDGYYDNYAHAYPILRARNMPAVIFLTTDFIGKDHPFYWDYVSYCFHHTQKSSANLPLQEPVTWTGALERKRVMRQWIDQLKQLPDTDKQRAVAELAGILEVHVPEGAFSGLHLSWDQVREMSQNGIEMGSHTVSHPILTRIPLTQAEAELVTSKQRIELEIKKPVIGFAYPNGGRSDFSPAVMQLVRQAGYEMAFSLVGGVTSFTDVKTHPFAIRRIFLSASDTLPRFMAKLALGKFL